MKPVLTKKEICKVARCIVETLEQGGYRCCLFGSAACLVWGMAHRVPNDVDVVVFSDDDPEYIKAYLADMNSRCYLEDAQSPKHTYKKLFYSLPWPTGLRCKVDILTAGRNGPLQIPKIPYRHIQYVRGRNKNIPVIPFLVLLILKVQAWDHRQISNRRDQREKIPQDELDIDKLLGMVDDIDHLGKFRWLPKWFINHAENLIGIYSKENPLTVGPFRYMGFDV